MPTPSRTEREAQLRKLLAQLGTSMVATGETVHEVEEELAALARHLGHPDLQVAAAPTGVTLTLESGGVASFQSVDGALRLDQAVESLTGAPEGAP